MTLRARWHRFLARLSPAPPPRRKRRTIVFSEQAREAYAQLTPEERAAFDAMIDEVATVEDPTQLPGCERVSEEEAARLARNPRTQRTGRVH